MEAEGKRSLDVQGNALLQTSADAHRLALYLHHGGVLVGDVGAMAQSEDRSQIGYLGRPSLLDDGTRPGGTDADARMAPIKPAARAM